jgi:WD40 repeat protein
MHSSTTRLSACTERAHFRRSTGPRRSSGISAPPREPRPRQLVCSQLWASLGEDVRLIGVEDIADLGDVDSALASYYDSCVERVAKETNVKQRTIREWIETRLITADRSRNIIEKGPALTGGLQNDVVSSLQALYLIRIEMRGTKPWIELTHDRFVEPILRANALWREANVKRSGVEWVLDLETRAQQWIDASRPASMLISGSELARAKEWARAAAHDEFEGSPAFREFVNASDVVVNSRRRRLVASMAVLAATAAVALASVIFVLQSQHVSELERQKSEIERQKSEIQRATDKERGTIAKTLAQQKGNEFLAAVLGIHATHSSIGSGTPVQEASDGLRAALDAIGKFTWLRGHSSAITTVRFSEDGKRVSGRGQDETCWWDTTAEGWENQRLSHRCIRWQEKESTSVSVEPSPGMRWLKVVPNNSFTENSSPRIYDTSSAAPTLEARLAGARGAHFLENGSRLLVIDKDWGGHVLVTESGQESARIDKTPPNATTGVSTAGSVVAFVQADVRKVYAWSLRTDNSNLTELELPDAFQLGNAALTLLVAERNQRIAMVSYDYQTSEVGIVSWKLDLAQNGSIHSSKAMVQPPTRMQFRPAATDIVLSEDGSTLVVLAPDAVWRWNLDHALAAKRLPLPAGSVARLLDSQTMLLRTSSKEGGKTRTTVALQKIGDKIVPLEQMSVLLDDDIVDIDISKNRANLAVINSSNQLRIKSFTNAEESLKDKKPAELLTLACQRIRLQDEFKEVASDCQ